MAETIKTETILIKDGTFLPVALQFDSEPCATAWRLVKTFEDWVNNELTLESSEWIKRRLKK
jgi:hypothetical protein